MRWTWLAPVVSLVVAACSAPAPSKPHAPVGSVTAAGSSRPAVEPGPTFEPGDTLTIEATLELAGRVALALEAARELTAIAEADHALARASWWPEASVGTRYWRNEGEVQSTVGQFLDVDKQNTFLYGEVAWRLDLAGALFGTRAASERASAAAIAEETARQDVSLLAAWRFLDLVEADRAREIAAEAVEHAQALVAFEEARLLAGSGLDVDLARARTHEARALGATLEAARRRAIASESLAELLRLPPGTQLEVEPPFHPAAAQPPLEDLLERAEATRPDLAEARFRLRAARHEQDGAEGAWIWPEIELAAAAGGYGENYGELEDKAVFAAGLVWRFGAMLSAREGRQRAAYRLRRIELDELERQVAAEVVEASTWLYTALARLDVVAEETRSAEEAARIARERYELGAGLSVVVLEAEVDLVRARAAEANAAVDAHRAHFALSRATGELE